MTDDDTHSDPLDGTYVAVLDRFEEDVAVLLVEKDEQIVDEQLVERAALPDGGRHQDAVFELRFEDGEMMALEYDQETTEERAEATQDRFDRLSERLPRDDDATEG